MIARWNSMLERAISLAIECGQLRPGDASQYAFELYAIPLNVHHQAGLFGFAQARRHGEAAVARWLAANAATSPQPRFLIDPHASTRSRP